MGLPEILIDFKAKAETAIARSQNGIVAVILADDTVSGDNHTSYVYQTSADFGVSSYWSTTNRRYLSLIFKGAPKKILVERIPTNGNYTDALARLRGKKWNWLCIPGLPNDKVEEIKDWVISQRSAKKTFKAVLPCTAANVNVNDEGIVDFATDGIKCGAYTYTPNEYCARIAGLLAGLPMDVSSTYYVMDDVTSINESLTPDNDIDAGKFILINDGEKIKVGRGINSLHILSGNKTEDMKKIKIIEGVDLMRDDIRTSFEENYIGINNSYDNKMLFVAAVNQYFASLERQGILYDAAENRADIDVDAQREWLSSKYDISKYSDDQIRQAKTGSYVFVNANVTFSDAIEDLNFTINMA